MKRFKTILKRDKSASQAGPSAASNNNTEYNFDNAAPDSPEADVARNIRLFCESGSMSNGGEEVLHLPSIVDAAESSPTAAASAAQQIRKFLQREWAAKPHVQYNAIMVMRILCDNPGPSFTRNFDKSFVSTVKEVLRMCKDGSTQQILRETLDNLEANKEFQEGMGALIQMWRKEKGNAASLNGAATRGVPAGGLAPANDYSYRIPTRARENERQERQNSYSRRGQLPPPVELASRIEESRNTAKILLQLIQSTPSEEVLGNDLIKEFADRCQSAQKSMQGYINSENPAPDDDTMLTLIETNEQLSLASSRYQRSLLSARKAAGLSPSPNAEAMQNNTGGPFQPPTAPPTANQNDNLFAQNSNPPQRSPSNDYEAYQAPPGPPPRQSTGMNAPTSNSETYSAPPGPPPAMLNRLNSREGQSPVQNQPPRIPTPEQASDPFADPVEHDHNPPPLAVEPGYYGRSKATRPPHPANRPHSQTFSVDAGPTYAPGQISGNAYDGSASATAEARERLGHNGDVPEIDGHSEVGRKAPNTPPGQVHDDAPNSAYDVSPMESRRGYQ